MSEAGATLNNNPLGLLDPNNLSGQRVEKLGGYTAPYKYIEVEPRYYILDHLDYKMIRTDGTPIHSRFGIIEAKDKYTIEYLEKELEAGHMYLQRATPEQIETYKVRINPRKALEDQIGKEYEDRLMNAERKNRELEEQLLALAGNKIDGTGGVDKVDERPSMTNPSGSVKSVTPVPVLGGIGSTNDLAGNSPTSGK